LLKVKGVTLKTKALVLFVSYGIVFLIALFLIAFISSNILNNSNTTSALHIQNNILGDTNEEIDMQLITDENLKNALLLIYNTVYNQERIQLFANDFLEFEDLNLTNYKISSIAGLNQFNFSNLTSLNLAFNDIEDSSFSEITDFALNNPNIRIILFFNKILNVENYPENIFLGMQNLKPIYINNSPDTTYVLYENYSNAYTFTINFKSRLDNSTMFSIQNGIMLNTYENVFSLTGLYTISFTDKIKRITFSFTLCYAEISLYNEVLTIEAGSNFIDEGLNFSLGLTKNNFIIEALNSENEEFQTDQLGEFALKYYVYEKDINSQKGELLLVLEQTIIVEDTTGPKITPNCTHAYSYINESYVDTGATAYDVIDGVCTVQIIGDIDINQEGTQTLIYKSTDSLGNESIFEKRVDIIYPPVRNIEISYQIENFSLYKPANFTISASGENFGHINPNQSYNIYVNDRLVKTVAKNEFNITFEKAGRNTLQVETINYDNTGKTVLAQSQTVTIDILENYWWYNHFSKTLWILIGFMVCVNLAYVAYIIYNNKINKLDLLYKHFNQI